MLQTFLNLDTSGLIWARSLISSEHALVVQILAESIVIFVMITLVFLWIKWVRKQDDSYKFLALNIFYTILLTFIVYGIINLWIPQWRPSPDDIAGGIQPLIPHPIGNSFPSGHALFAGAFIIGLLRYLPDYRIISVAIILSLITFAMRVIWWVHYPWDIIGGFIFGIIGSLILASLVQATFLQKKLSPLLIRIGKWIRL